MSMKEQAFKSIEDTITSFGLNDPSRSEPVEPSAPGKQEREIYAHWLKAIQIEMGALAELKLTAAQLFIIGRLIFALLAQASKADGNLPHYKMVAAAAKNLQMIGHLPECVVEALNTVGYYKP